MPIASESAALACAAEIIDVVPAAMNAVRASMRSHVDDGLSIPQFRCLGFIVRQPRSSVSDVAAFLGVTLATASAMVDRLVRAGHVDPSTSTADRRRSELSASASGKAVVSRIRLDARRDIASLLAEASEADLAVVAAGLSVMKKLFRRSPSV